MANNTRIIHTNSSDPWWNLSVEEYLLDRVEPGQCILYLWQNENTVVIGRNQNPWRECRTELLEGEGGKLARRLSGGGAVFHDIGNLNFTFIASRERYDLDKQLEVILGAVKALDIQAEKSGRNDLMADGRKFSGNAFCFRKNSAYHHGTVLVSADFSKLSKYLQVSAEKMNAKGIKSVQSRVVNLSELRPGLTVSDVAEALITSFRAVYESTAQVEHCIRDGSGAQEVLEELYCKYSSWKWRYGEAPSFDVDISKKFAWGEVQIGFTLDEGIVSKAVIYSDALDEAYIARLSGIFDGCPYNSGQLAQRLREEIGGEALQEMGREARQAVRREAQQEARQELGGEARQEAGRGAGGEALQEMGREARQAVRSISACGMDAELFGPDAQWTMTEDLAAWLEDRHF